MEQKSLKSRVEDFNALRLPGQMPMMHMGTLYLVNDLWREIERLQKEIAEQRDQILEEAAIIASNSCLVPPDGGQPSAEEIEAADRAAQAIRAAKSTQRDWLSCAPAQAAMRTTDDNC